jgi:hypothetical protein
MWYYFKEDYKSFLELWIAHESLKKLQKTFKSFQKLEIALKVSVMLSKTFGSFLSILLEMVLVFGL